MTEFKKQEAGGNQLRSKSYKSDNQKEDDSIEQDKANVINENLLASRKYYGANTHRLVGALRCFKLGGFRGTEVHTISDFIEWWDSTGKIKKRKGKHIPLKTSSLRTEISIWAVIQKGRYRTYRSYGYDVKINQ